MTHLSMLTVLPFLFTDKHILKELPAVTTPINLSINLSLIHSDQTFLYTTPLKAHWWRPLMYVLMKVTNNMGVAKSGGYFSALSYVNSHWPSTQLTAPFLSWRLWSHTLLFLSPILLAVPSVFFTGLTSPTWNINVGVYPGFGLGYFSISVYSLSLDNIA